MENTKEFDLYPITTQSITTMLVSMLCATGIAEEPEDGFPNFNALLKTIESVDTKALLSKNKKGGRK